MVYAGVDVVCLTSLNEGTPVSLIEAQAANKPIVSTRVGGIQDVVCERDTALLASNSVAEFSELLLQLVEDDALRAAMSKNGWDFVRERFHYTRLVRDMEELYNKLLKAQGELRITN